MVQSRKSSNGIYAILGMGVITALLIVGSGHVAVPFSFKNFNNSYYDDFPKYNKNYHDDDDDDDDDDRDDDNDRKKHGYSYQPSYQSQHQPNGLPLLLQEAANICASNVINKSKIKIDAKDGALVQITCRITQTQSVTQAPPIDPIQDATNVCASSIDGYPKVSLSGNKIEIKAKDGAVVKITCTITQTQNLGSSDPLLIQQGTNICGSNIGSKNKLEIKAKDGSAVIIKCEITQTQTVMQSQPTQPVDPLQDSLNICGSNIGAKNKIKISAKDGSSVVIACQNNQTQTIGTDPLLFQESTNICGSNIGSKNQIKITAKDGSSVVISCENNQTQSIGFVDP
jgi:hypothetical protein